MNIVPLKKPARFSTIWLVPPMIGVEVALAAAGGVEDRARGRPRRFPDR